MWCFKCGNETKVIGTYQKTDNTILRARVCKNCEHFFSSTEFIEKRENVEKYLKSLEDLPNELKDYCSSGFEKYL